MYFQNLNKIIHHHFKTVAAGDDFRAPLQAGLKLLEEKRATKWLSDDRNNKILSMEDSDWADRSFGIQAMKAGWRAWAMVLPEDRRAQINIERLMQQRKEYGMEIRAFSDVEEALSWLKKQ